jgi:hypothetical protein
MLGDFDSKIQRFSYKVFITLLLGTTTLFPPKLREIDTNYDLIIDLYFHLVWNTEAGANPATFGLTTTSALQYICM